MKPDKRFVGLPKTFWAHVRSISEEIGYTDRKTKEIRIPKHEELADALTRRSLSAAHLRNRDGTPSDFAVRLHAYFLYRADV